ncbi:MAG: ribonuclease HII [Tissierellaceae bacterium]|nr:ribonuclease HII [Tissierellia bacterium]
MLEFENRLHQEGYELIAGVDEVGRGCLLGDVIACALIMPKGLVIEGVKDSKKLSQKKREELYDVILNHALAIGIGQVSPDLIDEINIKASARLAMKRAIENLRDRKGKILAPDYILIDAEEIDLSLPQESIIKGDELSHTIACASIIAKVYRDNLCLKWDEEYPGYNIRKHKGYGTKEHREKILSLGPSPIHRRTFLRKILKSQ